jgi:hypothetical protein
MTGLTEGEAYRFEVTALNYVGESAPSTVSSFIAADFPIAPSAPYLIASTSTTVNLGWQPPTDNGGATINGYEVWFKLSTYCPIRYFEED